MGLDDLRRLETAPTPRASTAQRKLALVQADRVREALRGFALSDSVADLARLRRARTRGLS